MFQFVFCTCNLVTLRLAISLYEEPARYNQGREGRGQYNIRYNSKA